jgi:PSP1 C-terminal conserved region
MLLGRSNAGLRRSTPDSEALASSDDETEQARSAPAPPKITKNTRRTSWLTDIPPSHRKTSTTASGPYSPSGSHPATPSADSSTWNQTGTPVLGSNGAWNPTSSFPWGPVSNENQRPIPSRLQEVLHTPTTIANPPKFLKEDQTTAGGDRAAPGDTNLPFAIPIQPTPKNYRSQSYSVGQLDTGAVLNAGTTPESTRARVGGPFPNLQRRSSRTGVLGERLHDSGVLDQVAEVEDDEEAPATRPRNDALAQSQAQIEHLQKENANLRMEQAMQERARTGSSSEGDSGSLPPLRNNRIRGSVGQPGPETAIDDNEDEPDLSSYQIHQRLSNRGASEQYNDRAPLSALDDRNAGRAHWQTAQRFETALELPHSRRHSFADIPTRQGSFSSTDNNNNAAQLAREQWWPNNQQERGEDYRMYGRGTQGLSRDERRLTLFNDSRQEREKALHVVHLINREFAAKYFRIDDPVHLAAEARARDPYAVGDPYGRPRGFGAPTQPLFIVTFKCYRADVFYIQEGTGLQVNPGDLVIVEADRGTDLGSVMQADITWEQARALKEYYAEEHYKLLMMFSDEARNGGPNALNPNGLSGMQGQPGSAVGGMGPPGHHGHHEASHSDIKPKMIRRLAQNHEIESLKEKERNEAKAKRVCRQKVGEHRLNMEVLDAEFQM